MKGKKLLTLALALILVLSMGASAFAKDSAEDSSELEAIRTKVKVTTTLLDVNDGSTIQAQKTVIRNLKFDSHLAYIGLEDLKIPESYAPADPESGYAITLSGDKSGTSSYGAGADTFVVNDYNGDTQFDFTIYVKKTVFPIKVTAKLVTEDGNEVVEKTTIDDEFMLKYIAPTAGMAELAISKLPVPSGYQLVSYEMKNLPNGQETGTTVVSDDTETIAIIATDSDEECFITATVKDLSVPLTVKKIDQDGNQIGTIYSNPKFANEYVDLSKIPCPESFKIVEYDVFEKYASAEGGQSSVYYKAQSFKRNPSANACEITVKLVKQPIPVTITMVNEKDEQIGRTIRFKAYRDKYFDLGLIPIPENYEATEFDVYEAYATGEGGQSTVYDQAAKFKLNPTGKSCDITVKLEKATINVYMQIDEKDLTTTVIKKGETFPLNILIPAGKCCVDSYWIVYTDDNDEIIGQDELKGDAKEVSMIEGTANCYVSVTLKDHDMKHHKKVEPTCTEDGTEGYHECTCCKKLFKDPKGFDPIEKPIVIKATGHKWGKDGVCTVCGAKQTAPQTGDNSNSILWIVLAIVAVAGIVTAVTVRRKGNR